MMSWYDRVKKDLIEVGEKLRRSDISQEEREAAYKTQIDLICELDDIFTFMNELSK